MYITWKYDVFPYLLCGKVKGKIDEDGYYRVEGFDGMRFQAKTVINNNKNGQAVKEKIAEVAQRYRELKQTLEAGWTQELNSFINNTI